MIKKTEQEEPNERPGEPSPWHVKMTCRNCTKKRHVAALCPDNEIKMSDQTADANVQEGQVDEEAAQQLLDGSRLLANENEELCADLLSCEDQERRSASFQLKDGSPVWRSLELELVRVGFETRFWFDPFFACADMPRCPTFHQAIASFIDTTERNFNCWCRCGWDSIRLNILKFDRGGWGRAGTA